MTHAWFSCMVRMVGLIDGVGKSSDQRSVFVFEAPSWPDAQRIALSLGRSLEKRYVNEAGQRVRIALRDLVTLDELGSLESPGREAFAEIDILEVPDVTVGFDVEFHPEDSGPMQTGV
jgi:hypothetical protein